MKRIDHVVKKPAKDQQETRKEAAYPYYDLESAIKFASVIKDLGGSKSGIKKSLIAKQVGVAESTPSFFQKLSASKTFGIIEGWGEYGLTETGRNYFYPQSNEAQQQALLSLFITPSAFAFLLKRFDGEKLPSSDIVGNILHQELNVPDSWKDRVAQIFARSAQFVGIIDSGGFLRYDAAMHNKTSSAEEHRTQSDEQQERDVSQQPDTNPTVPPHITRYKRGFGSSSPKTFTITEVDDAGMPQCIYVEVPKNLTLSNWELLSKWLESMKPKTTP